MKDDEIDDLFRRNADYLADEPARNFDKAAFWQQLQTEIPKKADCQRVPAAWWWAAASVLLAGICGGVWWMQSAGREAQNLAVQKMALPKMLDSTPWAVSPQTDGDVAEGLWGGTSIRHRPRTTKVEPLRGQFVEKFDKIENQEKPFLAQKETFGEKLTNLPAPSEIAPTLVTVESLPEPSEVSTEATLEKPAYRVVHINEIRERKQQEAKARSRVSFRIGLASGSRMTTQSDNKPLLNIPLQH